jgi:hypothetical protein
MPSNRPHLCYYRSRTALPAGLPPGAAHRIIWIGRAELAASLDQASLPLVCTVHLAGAAHFVVGIGLAKLPTCLDQASLPFLPGHGGDMEGGGGEADGATPVVSIGESNVSFASTLKGCITRHSPPADLSCMQRAVARSWESSVSRTWYQNAELRPPSSLFITTGVREPRIAGNRF